MSPLYLCGERKNILSIKIDNGKHIQYDNLKCPVDVVCFYGLAKNIYIYPVALLTVNTTFNIDLQFETAPIHLRMFAWFIDFFLLIMFWVLMSKLLNSAFSMENASAFGLTELFLVTPFLLYHLFFEVFCGGQSPGKMIFKIQVISLNGENASISQYLLRWLLRFIDFGMLWGMIFMLQGATFLGTILFLAGLGSFILFLVTPYSQRLGDWVAGTTTALKKLNYKLSDTIFQELDTNSYKVFFPQVMRLSDKDINIIDNIVKQHNKSNIANYVATVADKIKKALKIETEFPDDIFLETLLRDYNYLSRK